MDEIRYIDRKWILIPGIVLVVWLIFFPSNVFDKQTLDSGDISHRPVPCVWVHPVLQNQAELSGLRGAPLRRELSLCR